MTRPRQPCHFTHYIILKRIDIEIDTVDDWQEQERNDHYEKQCDEVQAESCFGHFLDGYFSCTEDDGVRRCSDRQHECTVCRHGRRQHECERMDFHRHRKSCEDRQNHCCCCGVRSELRQ